MTPHERTRALAEARCPHTERRSYAHECFECVRAAIEQAEERGLESLRTFMRHVKECPHCELCAGLAKEFLDA